MIYITGDKHGDYDDVVAFCKSHNTTKKDVMIVLGDHGCLYYSDSDNRTKHLLQKLENLPITFVMIRGDHDRRPFVSDNGRELRYFLNPSFTGWFYVDKAYPSILFTLEYGWYWFTGRHTFIIGGAHSFDAPYHCYMRDMAYKNYRWFSNERLSLSEMKDALDVFRLLQLKKYSKTPFYIMSHTAPMKYVPDDAKKPVHDERFSSDFSMEKWMDELESAHTPSGLTYSKWYCGHWHIDKEIDNVRFMYNDIIPFY